MTRRHLRTVRRGMLLGGIVLGLFSASACSSMKLGVEPWQRDLLAEHSMDPSANALDNGIDDHIYFSKEASSGGRGFGGGGCGCN